MHFQLLEEDIAQTTPQCSEKIASRFEIIHGELHRLKSIVNQFLRLAGPSALELEVLNPASVVNHVCELLRPEAAIRRIEIQTGLGADLPNCRADSVKLTQALVNLVINAMQAVNKDGTIRVGAAIAGDLLAFEVCDSGPGIPAEQLASIFDPYFTTKNEGHGLGLWIAQQIATAHHGQISARNLPERGAIFTLLIPLNAGSIASPCG